MTKLDYPALGWTAHFARQAEADETHPRRIAEVHRDRVVALSPDGMETLVAPQGTGHIAVGDWVTVDSGRVGRILDRQTCLSRRAAGSDAREQLIAANVTTLGIVTSCNADFNERRLERYLVLAAEAGCLPLVILTKADLCDDPGGYEKRARRLSPLLTPVALDATDPEELRRLDPWCRTGETLALVGSSGVGKTTIRNGLTDTPPAGTQGIREDDAKGRHTTTARSLIPTAAGGWLIDTPGMRALRLAGVSEGIEAVFSDIETLAADCRFSDCIHDTEPGCAVQAAIEDGTLDPDRLTRWRKLRAEDARNSETIAEARARARGFGRVVRKAMDLKRQDRGEVP